MLNKEEQDHVLKDYTREDVCLMENDVWASIEWSSTFDDAKHDAIRSLEKLVGIARRLMDIQDYPKDEVTE